MENIKKLFAAAMAMLLFSLPALAVPPKKAKKPVKTEKSVKHKKAEQSEYIFKAESADTRSYRFNKKGDPIEISRPKPKTKTKKKKDKHPKKPQKAQPKKQENPAEKKTDQKQESFEGEVSN